MSDLSQSPYFKDIKPEALKKILALSKKKTCKEGEYIVRESDKGGDFYYIVKGRVDITVSLVSGSDTEKIATLNEGELVGEMILLGKTRRTANVLAKSKVEILEWTVDSLLHFFEADPVSGYVFMRNMAASIGERLSATNQVLRNALTIPKNFIL